MKPARFQYCAPRSLDEVLTVLRQCGPDVKVLAGGQSLLPLLNMRLAMPQYLVDINRVSSLDYIEAREGYLAIGAITRQRDVERSALVLQRYPLVADVIQHIGHAQIRNRGTVVGSIAHADPAAELPALLICVGGSVVVRSGEGERRIKAEEFFVDYLLTALDTQEIVTEIRLPWLPAQSGWACMEIARRSGDFALAGAIAIVIRAPDGTCATARISYYGIAATPVRGYAVEQLLIGTKLEDEVLESVADVAAQMVSDELSDIHATVAYRRSLTAELTRRVLREAWQRCL
jgi:CO/xanthine dehydrogenase FAD-binding subunit